MVDKGKSSWIKKAKVKAMVIYDKTAKIDLEKRRREWNLEVEITKGFKKGVELGIDFNSKSKSTLNTRTWNLEEEVTKVIETGSALGFDFNGMENEMADQLHRRELEDEERCKEAQK
ncbi:hypothetical protein LWI28_019517 [Acer negundo]|uniref:Uncharacterized protein n=1 Tax=Acer negundo TaxID=4023 RepID=A0AAD5J209_ACENE|nr:hypothetical protein LWI28_019517 [Acer negundo]